MAYKRCFCLGRETVGGEGENAARGQPGPLKKKRPALPLAPSILYGHRRPRLYRDSCHTPRSSDDPSQNRTIGCKYIMLIL